MEQVIKETGLSPEQVDRIKAAQKRHAAIDPACVNLTPEEFINWHPVGGISSEERARLIRERLRKNGKVLINSTGSLDRLPGTMELSRIDYTFHWFTAFLAKSVTLKDKFEDEYKTDGRTYKAFRDDSGNVFLKEIRDSGFVSDIAFSAAEIPQVLMELRCMEEQAQVMEAAGMVEKAPAYNGVGVK
jgi:hypothetical protein